MQVDFEQIMGEFVRRERRGRQPAMTQQELADRLAEIGEPMHATAITRLEQGKRSLRLNEWMALLIALDTDAATFFDFARATHEMGEVLAKRLERGNEESTVRSAAGDMVTITEMALALMRDTLQRAGLNVDVRLEVSDGVDSEEA